MLHAALQSVRVQSQLLLLHAVLSSVTASTPVQMPLQAWPSTRVVLDDREQGRVLLVQPGDSSAALSKVSVSGRPACQV